MYLHGNLRLVLISTAMNSSENVVLDSSASLFASPISLKNLAERRKEAAFDLGTKGN
jgi:hypothetical protein